MNAVFITNIEEQSTGGVAQSVRLLSKYLEKNNHQIYKIYNNRNFNFIFFSLYAHFKILLLLFQSKIDVLICRSTDGFFSFCLIKLFSLKIKTVLYNHGWEPYVYEVEKRLPKSLVDNPTTLKGQFIRFQILKLSMYLSDIIISGTIHETRKLRNQFKHKKKSFKYLPNPIIANNVQPQKSKNISLSIVANINWKKNLNYAVELFISLQKNIPTITMNCIGTGLLDDDFISQFGSIKGLKNFCTVNPSEINAIYRSSHYILSTSRYEGGHSFSILEGINNGCIPIVSSIKSLEEIVKNNCNGIVITGNNTKIDTSILETFFNQDTTAIQKNAKSMSEKFEINIIGKKFLKIIV